MATKKKKKPGIPVGTQKVDGNETRMRVSNALDHIAFGAIDKDGKFKKVSVTMACEKFNLTRTQFYTHTKDNEALNEKYLAIKSNRLFAIKDKAEDNLMEAMDRTGDFVTMEAKDRARLSLDILKQTDKAYNPKLEIDAKVDGLDLSVSLEDMTKMILELTEQ